MDYFDKKTALGSEAALAFSGPKRQAADEIMHGMWRQIFEFERAFSRFLPASELSVFNRGAGLRQPVTPQFRDLLKAAKKMAQKTGGLYNPFVLPALQAAGYKQSMLKGHEGDDTDDFSDRAVVTADQLHIGDDWAQIPYGTALDMGGCGKGYLADQLADYIEGKVDGYWLSLGGDVVTGGHSARKIGIQDAGAPEQDIGWVVTNSRRRLAAATSGTIARRGQRHGKTWHHLIDPRRGQPAETDIRLATVCAGTCLDADVLASCAVILGSPAAPVFLKEQRVTDYLLQTTGAQVKHGRLIRLSERTV